MTIKGKLIVKRQTQEIKADFKKRDFVVETTEQFPQKIPFQLLQDKVNLIDGIEVGKEIEVHFNFKGTQYDKDGEETKYFLNLTAWKITY
ncbi:hypothetical protein F132_60 [Flavobacterium sp. phage 1/32]|nr:hypothetical protein F132_60 [Flavobacterium sp. phage 1/32]